MQNHLLQVLSIVAMEEPVTMTATDIRNAKTKALSCISPLKVDDVILGQYTSGMIPGAKEQVSQPVWLERFHSIPRTPQLPCPDKTLKTNPNRTQNQLNQPCHFPHLHLSPPLTTHHLHPPPRNLVTEKTPRCRTTASPRRIVWPNLPLTTTDGKTFHL